MKIQIPLSDIMRASRHIKLNGIFSVMWMGEVYQIKNTKLVKMFRNYKPNCGSCGAGNIMATLRKEKNRYSVEVDIIREDGQKTKLTRDHVVPSAFNGSQQWVNVEPLCEICNREKGCKLPEGEMIEIVSSETLYVTIKSYPAEKRTLRLMNKILSRYLSFTKQHKHSKNIFITKQEVATIFNTIQAVTGVYMSPLSLTYTLTMRDNL